MKVKIAIPEILINELTELYPRYSPTQIVREIIKSHIDSAKGASLDERTYINSFNIADTD